MGAYLSEPITTKESSVEENEGVRVAASSMQGWRVSQEDAHNAILNFDERTSLFAVYDGHGGHEVAEYTAKKFPSFIKRNEDYKNGNIQKALIDCFVEFDRTIVNRDVVAELKRIAGKTDDDLDDPEEVAHEVDHLYQEATMPLEDVIAKYEATESMDEKGPSCDANKDNAESTENQTEGASAGISKPKLLQNPIVAALTASSGSKPISPYLRAKKDKDESVDSIPSAKEIDFEKVEDKSETEITNNALAENQPSLEGSNKTDILEKDVMKQETNGDHKTTSIKAQDNINASGDSVTLTENQKTDKDGNIPENATIGKNDMDISKSNQPEVTNDSIGNHSEKTNEMNGECGESIGLNKGKGKGKGKGKSNTMVNKTPTEEEGNVEVAKFQPRSKRTSKSAAELYHNILNDNENEDDELVDDEDDSDEDAVYGQDESESDDDEEEEDGIQEDENGDIDEEDSEDEEEEDEHDHEEFIGGEFNEDPGNDSGCTAVVAVIRGNELFVANAGDSRCVVCRDGTAIEMSFDHKPEDAPERDRIETAGGRVTPDGRVNGGLNLSRAIGDHAYKTNKNLPLQEQMISPVPDVRTLQLDHTKDSYIVLACDGIWNSLTSQEVVDFVSERLDKLQADETSKDPTSQQLQTICEELFEHCLAPDTMNDGTGMDNMTAVIVKLRPTFDGNKAAKNLLADEGCSSSTPADGTSSSPLLLTSNISLSKPTSSSADKITPESDRAFSNGESAKPISSSKRTLECSSEESSNIETQCSKKPKLDEKENGIASKANQPAFVQT